MRFLKYSPVIIKRTITIDLMLFIYLIPIVNLKFLVLLFVLYIKNFYFYIIRVLLLTVYIVISIIALSYLHFKDYISIS